ncbi:Acyl-Coenzyme A Thioesterase 1 [Manis pentadactyla]|nr:Acyl-Coenzyme A Thioesterase 1 [Manis pentadactyla]
MFPGLPPLQPASPLALTLAKDVLSSIAKEREHLSVHNTAGKSEIGSQLGRLCSPGPGIRRNPQQCIAGNTTMYSTEKSSVSNGNDLTLKTFEQQRLLVKDVNIWVQQPWKEKLKKEEAEEKTVLLPLV